MANSTSDSIVCRSSFRASFIVAASGVKHMRYFAFWIIVTAVAASSSFADAPDEVATLQSRFFEFFEAGQYDQAEPLGQRMLALAEKRAAAQQSDELTSCLTNLARLYEAQGRFREAEPLYQRSLKLADQAKEPNLADVATALTDLGITQVRLGNYVEAEQCYRKSLSIREKVFGSENRLVAFNLTNMGDLANARGRYIESETLFLKALAIYQREKSDDRTDEAVCLNNLAFLYRQQGRYADSERLYRQALAMHEKAAGPNQKRIGMALNNLANLYIAQGRYADAEPVCLRSKKILDATLRVQNPMRAYCLNNLAMVYLNQGRHIEAEPLFEQALAIRRQAFGAEHPLVALSLESLALARKAKHQYDSAESLFEESLALRKRTLGPNHPDVASTLIHLATLREEQGRAADGEPLADKAIAILDGSHASLERRFGGYFLRARLAWELGNRQEAVKDLQEALVLADQQRGRAGGAEQERAQQFGRFGAAFETMVAWQAELGDAGDALMAIERSRARSLLDEINVAGADLQTGRASGERDEMSRREEELTSKVTELEGQLAAIATAQDTASGLRRTRLMTELSEAREQLYAQHRDARSANPIYRNLLTVGTPPRLRQLQRSLLAEGDLALVYLFGEQGGYVVAVGPQQARVVRLMVDAATAKVLGTTAGVLTAKRLQEILVGTENTGVVRQLAKSPATPKSQDQSSMSARLAALWPLLIPEAERDALTNGKCKRLFVVPDGPLALFPFETLVIHGEESPDYLLDAGPPILYGPSLTVLFNLTGRPIAATGPRPPVLTIADPVYPLESGKPAGSQNANSVQLASRSRYVGIGGQLTRLPYTGEEAIAVATAFTNAGLQTGSLLRDLATEESVRSNISGRKIVHLACHGMTDHAYGNFFGALALTPGKQAGSNSADDGFLTLPEIYELDMKGCELAILSACETNYGPQQQGEGVWALSRGFLVSGARRVVASNWLVDDEAGAQLIGYFCAALAEDEKSGAEKHVDYASRLQAAKKWVRSQNRWKNPYYWSTFVLIGPS